MSDGLEKVDFDFVFLTMDNSWYICVVRNFFYKIIPKLYLKSIKLMSNMITEIKHVTVSTKLLNLFVAEHIEKESLRENFNIMNLYDKSVRFWTK